MSTKEAQRAASQAYRKRQKAAGARQLGFALTPEALAALEPLAKVHGSKNAAVNAALISAAERLAPERSSAKPSAVKADGATPKKQQPKASDKPAPLGRLKGHWKAP